MKSMESILDSLKETVCGDRMEKYGDPYEVLGFAAKLCSTYFGHDVTRTDMAAILGFLKTARSKHGCYHDDDYFDKIGYALLEAYVAEREQEEVAD